MFNTFSASCAEKPGGSEASLSIESRRLRIDGDNNAADSRFRPSLTLARDLDSGSDGVMQLTHCGTIYSVVG